MQVGLYLYRLIKILILLIDKSLMCTKKVYTTNHIVNNTHYYNNEINLIIGNNYQRKRYL